MEILHCKEKGDIFWKFAILLVYTIPMFLKKPASQSVSESVSQSVRRSVSQSVSQSSQVQSSPVSQPVSQSVSQSVSPVQSSQSVSLYVIAFDTQIPTRQKHHSFS